MSSEEDKPPAPPVRLTSNRGGGTTIDRADSAPPVDMRPLPKGLNILCLFLLKILWSYLVINLIKINSKKGY